MERFVIYRCGSQGAIQHGAYSNMDLYRDALIAECDGAPLMQHGTNRQREWDLEFKNIVFDASGYDYAIEAAQTRNNHPPTLFTRCTLLGYVSAAVAHPYERSSGTEP